MSIMKKGVLLMTIVLFGTIAPGFAQEGELHGDVGYTYDSLHVWRGFLTWGHHSGSNYFIDLDLMGSGFGISTEAHRANASGYENGERWDYTAYYRNLIGAPDDKLATAYQVSYVYYNYPDNSSHTRNSADLQEINALFSWPNITGVKGLVPRYCIVKLWATNSGSWVASGNANGGSANGFAHIFMLDYALPIAGLTSETSEQTLNFHTELVYNDGVDPRPMGGYTSHDWTDFVMGVSTDFDLGHNLIFTPGVYHQITMEDDAARGVSPDHNITWASLTVKYKF
jgi:hypothetical protein